MSETNELSPITRERLVELRPDAVEFLKGQAGKALALIEQASRFLTRLVLADPQAFDVLVDLDTRAAPPHAEGELVRWKQFELLRIAARDLTEIDSLDTVGANLSKLADDVFDVALKLVGVEEQIAVMGMGKLGGNELNYASDVDVMFVGEGDESTTRAIMNVARKCFRVDANLRPEGRDGALIRSVDSYRRYWDEWASTWEFQALLKARPIAGSGSIGYEWHAAANRALWSHDFGTDEIRALRDMKARSEELVARRGLLHRELKRGRGGIRDIDFAVQMLQLVHGKRDECIRSATTLTALSELSTGGYIAADDAETLSDCYRFLRTVEHRLQLVEEQQTHTLPNGREERIQLARSMGYRDGPNNSALEDFEKDLKARQSTVRHAHERLYFRPLLEAFSSDRPNHSDAIDAQLIAFGFADAERTRQAVSELTRGLARSSRLMQQLMPLLLDWLSVSPDPDAGLLGLRTLVAGFRTPNRVVSVFRDSPEVARRLCLLLGTSQLFSRGIATNTELLKDLSSDQSLLPDVPTAERLRQALEWRQGQDQRHIALLRLVREEQLRIAAADVLGIIDSTEAGVKRSALAEAVLELTLEKINPDLPIALIAMGRFGGGELAYASDLDIIVVHDGRSSEQQLAADRIAQQLLQLISDPTPNKNLYPLDYDLRPEGKKGVLARSLEGCRDYYEKWADTWERQALLRARPVAGDERVAEDFMSIVHPFIWDRTFGDSELREVRHLKARMENERIPRGEDPQYHLKLGKGSLSDVEWTVQLLQLQHHIEGTSTLQVLATLKNKGIIEREQAAVLEEAWRFCDRTRNRLFLVNNGGGDALPSSFDRLAVLARSLHMAPTQLRERYKKVTRRSRVVVEELFYGQNQQ